MFSIADMAVAGAVALLLFGPDQLPKVARRAGQLVRDVQNTSQSFIREMERAADAAEVDGSANSASTPPLSSLPAAPLYHETPEPAAHELVERETVVRPHPNAGPGKHEAAGKHAAPESPPGQPAP